MVATRNKIKVNAFTQLEKISDKIECNCDYLTLTVRDKNFYNPIFSKWKLDFDRVNNTNSNYQEIDIIYNNLEHILLTKSSVKGDIAYNIEIVCDLGVMPIFQIIETVNKNAGMQDYYGRVNIYGAFFRLQEIGYIDYDFFTKLGIDLQETIITRYDYKIDCFGLDTCIDPKLVIDGYYNSKASMKTFQEYSDKELISGWSFGFTKKEGVRTKNKSVHIRCYDKVLDSNIKHKELLYQDYVRYQRETGKKIYRLELECGSIFCKARGEIPFKEIEKIEHQIREYLHLEIKQGIFTKRYTMHRDLLDASETQKNNYIKGTIRRIETIQNSGYNILELIDLLSQATGLDASEIIEQYNKKKEQEIQAYLQK